MDVDPGIELAAESSRVSGHAGQDFGRQKIPQPSAHEKIGLLRSAIYGIDAKKYFDVSVDARLLFCEFNAQSHNYDYDVYESLYSANSQRVGHRNGMTVRDLDTFERLSKYYGNSKTKWRSGVKHDCSDVMEFQKAGDSFINGLGEVVDIESAYLYTLLKGSDVANNRIEKRNRYALVTQKTVGEPTSPIKKLAPKTWAYLESRAKYLDERKGRIYQDSPRFSVFGVGPYAFAPHKIAICGLYKNWTSVWLIQSNANQRYSTTQFIS